MEKSSHGHLKGIGLSKVKEKTKAKISAWKSEVEVFKHVTKYVKYKSEYNTPLVVSVLGIKDTRVIGVKLALFSTETATETIAFLPYSKPSHPDSNEKEEIDNFLKYFIERDPNFVLRFCSFNWKNFIVRRNKEAADVFQLDLWKTLPLELLLQWDLLLPIKSSVRRESVALLKPPEVSRV